VRLLAGILPEPYLRDEYPRSISSRHFTGQEDMMRRTLLLVAGFGLFSGVTASQAQTVFGVKGGLVSSTLKLSGEGTAEASPFMKRRSGVSGGAFLALGSGLIGLQVEGLYVQKGVKVAGDFEGTTFSGTLKVSYIEVPALLRLSFPAGSIRPYVYAGAGAAFEMKCEGEVTSDGQTQTGTCEEAEQQQAGTDRRKLDITALGGGGIQFRLSSLSILFEARYARGIRNLNKSGDGGAKNEALSFLTGVAIPIGGR